MGDGALREIVQYIGWQTAKGTHRDGGGVAASEDKMRHAKDMRWLISH